MYCKCLDERVCIDHYQGQWQLKTIAGRGWHACKAYISGGVALDSCSSRVWRVEKSNGGFNDQPNVALAVREGATREVSNYHACAGFAMSVQCLQTAGGRAKVLADALPCRNQRLPFAFLRPPSHGTCHWFRVTVTASLDAAVIPHIRKPILSRCCTIFACSRRVDSIAKAAIAVLGQPLAVRDRNADARQPPAKARTSL